MEGPFGQPTFLREGSIDPEVKASGSFVEVTDLYLFNEDLQKKIPPGYVLKRYRYDSGRQKAPLTIDPQAPETMAKILQRRHNDIKDFFTKDPRLKDLVVPTQYLIGSERNPHDPKKDGPSRLYEIQKKISFPKPSEVLHRDILDFIESYRRWYYFLCEGVRGYRSDEAADKFEEKVRLLSTKIADTIQKQSTSEQLSKIKEQLIALLDLAKRLEATLDIVPPDLFFPQINLVCTSEGMRIIDTNMAIEKKGRYKRHQLEEAEAMYNALTGLWGEIVKKL